MKNLLTIKYGYACFCFLLMGMMCDNATAQIMIKSVSGIYPSLANFNDENECGTGAVVPWAGKLWTISYGPHLPFGSSDKLYEISSDYTKITRHESIGGTPANRMVHKESNQLFIGPYVIDTGRNVRVLDIDKAPGRYTAMARSLSDPVNKVVLATMEQGIYEIDVHSLDVTTWFKDGNLMKREGAPSYQSNMVKGVHGKGFYSGQGVYIYANNGEDCQQAMVDPKIEAGVLAEYDGKSWKQIRRNQFTEITGPGGIYGSDNPEKDPIWALGWDYKSVLLGVRDVDKGWTFYRLPKASNSYDGAHGWNTEWPRIRNVGTDKEPNYLMIMHGMFWHFPKTFSSEYAYGVRPLSSYLKVIGDFCSWDGKLVFGCDDSAKSEFLNVRKAKGKIAAPGQSQSNLWFTSFNQPANTGTKDACGSVWQNEQVKAGEVSDPFIISGWINRTIWILNDSDTEVTYSLEIDEKGYGNWKNYKDVLLPEHSSMYVDISSAKGEWIRARINKATRATVAFVYSDSKSRIAKNSTIFNNVAPYNYTKTLGGNIYALGDNRRALGILANYSINGKIKDSGYYEMDDNLNIVKKNDAESAKFIRENMAIPSNVIKVDKGSYLIIDDSNRRWRLPLGYEKYGKLMQNNAVRICREVATERDLFNCGGTFYELPAENADGYAKIRPIATHNLQINDYGSYRGMLILTGISDGKITNADHIISSKDGKCKVWAGAIDDLWKLGKPTGKGGPWVDTYVKKNVASDPFLIGHYDKKTLTLSHTSDRNVTFTVQMDPTGDGLWMTYAKYEVKPGQKLVNVIPDGYFARWIRFVSDSDVCATAWLEYK